MPNGSAKPRKLLANLRPGRLIGFSALFVALSGLGSYAIYAEFAGRSFALDYRLFRWEAIATVIVLLAVYYATDALRLHFTLRALGHPVPIGQTFRLVFINLFFSNVTPMATGGGFAQIWYLRRRGVPVGTATAATTVRTLLAVAFIFTTTPAVLMGMDIFDRGLVSPGLLPVFAVFVSGYLGFFAVVLWRARWLVAPLDVGVSLLRRLHVIGAQRERRWCYALRREVVRFARGFRAYSVGPRLDVALSVLFTAFFLLSLFSFPAVLLWALGYTVEYVTVLALLVVTTFVMYFSPTPGASGIAEGVFGHFFAGLVTANHLVLVTLAWRFLTIFLGMLIGVVVLQVELAGTGRRRRGQE